MANLRDTVFSFVQQVRQKPADGSDPRVLEFLSKQAQDDWGGAFQAVNSPVADRTWEQRVQLLGSSSTTERLNFVLPFPMEIVGMYPTVVRQAAAVVVRDPSADLVDVSMDVNLSDIYTQANGISTPGGPNGGTYVTLSSFNSGTGLGSAGRQFGLRLTAPNPNLGFTFRWKLGANSCDTAIITMALFARRI